MIVTNASMSKVKIVVPIFLELNVCADFLCSIFLRRVFFCAEFCLRRIFLDPSVMLYANIHHAFIVKKHFC